MLASPHPPSFHNIRHSLTFLEARLDDITATLAEHYDVICAFVNDEVSSAVLDKCKEQNIGLIALRSAGCNNVDLEYLAKKELSLVHVPAYSPEAVAEHALALLLTLSRKIHKVQIDGGECHLLLVACFSDLSLHSVPSPLLQIYNRVRDGNFSLEGVTPGFVLHGKTVGVLGTGKIGECFIRIMMGLGCNVLGYDVKENPALQALQQQCRRDCKGTFEYKPLDEVLQVRTIDLGVYVCVCIFILCFRWITTSFPLFPPPSCRHAPLQASDIISLHLPLLPQTKGLINHDSLAKMKKVKSRIPTESEKRMEVNWKDALHCSSVIYRVWLKHSCIHSHMYIRAECGDH